MPEIPINYLAVLLCGIVSMVLGFLWFGPLFGKQYMKLTSMKADDMESLRNDPAMKRKLYMNYGLAFVGALIMAFVLDHSLIFAASYMQVSGMSAGLQAGFWSWLGFVAPVTLGLVLWDRKPWGYWFLLNGYYLIQLLVFGVILALWV